MTLSNSTPNGKPVMSRVKDNMLNEEVRRKKSDFIVVGCDYGSRKTV